MDKQNVNPNNRPNNELFSHKQNEALIHTTTQVNLKNSTLVKRSQTQRATHCIIPFVPKAPNREIHRDRKQISDCQGTGRKKGKKAANGCKFSFQVMKIFKNRLW